MKLTAQWKVGQVRRVEENNVLMERESSQDNFIMATVFQRSCVGKLISLN
jgi:hypothetical protein